MIKFSQKGDFKKLDRFFEKSRNIIQIEKLEKIAQDGLQRLINSTPVDSGITASSWSYDIKRNNDKIVISYYNSNVNNGIPIAILIQYGHATKNGAWIDGIDYINPALKPVFDDISKYAFEEVVSL